MVPDILLLAPVPVGMLMLTLMSVMLGCQNSNRHDDSHFESAQKAKTTEAPCPDAAPVYSGTVVEDDGGRVCVLDSQLTTKCEISALGECLGFVPYLRDIGWLDGTAPITDYGVTRCGGFDSEHYDVVSLSLIHI